MGFANVALPAYTSDLQEAHNLAHQIAPNHTGGCSWDAGLSHATVNDGPTYTAATPELALCMTALHFKLSGASN